jgi:hypothetical protein
VRTETRVGEDPFDPLAWHPVAASNTGSWVRRVGASGGGRTYRRRRPVNFYGVLVIIVVLGIASVGLARYDYQHPAGAVSTTPPAIGTTWVAALGISSCGTQLQALAPNPKAGTDGFQALKDGVIQIAPLSSAQAGNHAVLSAFIAHYPGLVVTSSKLRVPLGKRHFLTRVAGERCPKGTKDAGKVGHIEIATWPNLAATTPTVTSDPADVKFSQGELISIAFVPNGVAPPQPPSAAIVAMEAAESTVTTTTTTTVPATTTTKPPVTTTTHHKG